MSQVRYQLLGPLFPGEGATRPVLALALEAGTAPRPVVLVWAHPDIVQDADLLARLRKETARAVVFEHPHILRVHGLVELEGRVARVTEYADGEPLRRVLEVSPRLPPLFAALVASDVAMGVHYAHVAGNDDGSPFVHGDLRPETVMVSAQGVMKVTGYGALGVAPREKNGRRVRNRRLYSAPEQLLGGREASSIPTDVFLLGLLLHECLSGRKPFQDSIDQDKAILSRPLPPLPEDVPLAYNEIIRRATAKRAKERYPSALAFRDALVSIVGELPTPTAFAEFLTRQMPHDSEARRTRRGMIEQGIAALTSGPLPAARPAPAPTPAPTQVAVMHRPVAPVAVTPAPVPVAVAPVVAAPVPAPVPLAVTPAPVAMPVAGAPAPVPFPSVLQPPPGAAPIDVRMAPPPAAPEARSRLMPGAIITALGTLLFVSAVGLIWNIRHEPEVLAAEDAGAAEESLRAPVLIETAPAAPLDAGVPAPVAPARVPPSSPTPPPTPLTPVQIFVNPEVILYADGRPVGRTPLTAHLPPGRHLLSMVDEKRGLRTARTVDVRATQETVQFNIQLQLGSVTILAQAGAQVFLDGQRVGVAPLAAQSIFEGEHHVRAINPDKSVQEQDFVMPSSPGEFRTISLRDSSDGEDEPAEPSDAEQ